MAENPQILKLCVMWIYHVSFFLCVLVMEVSISHSMAHWHVNIHALMLDGSGVATCKLPQLWSTTRKSLSMLLIPLSVWLAALLYSTLYLLAIL